MSVLLQCIRNVLVDLFLRLSYKNNERKSRRIVRINSQHILRFGIDEGCFPDFVSVANFGLLEINCPKTTFELDSLRNIE